jgi:YNFM family putative membrane transporter
MRTGYLGGMLPFLFGAAAMFATMYSTQAILPELGRAFHVSPSASGLTISVLIVSLAIGAWFWGPLSDRIGRRRSLILASGFLVVPSMAVALAPTFPVLLLLRSLQGFCMPGLLTVGVPYIAEVYQPRVGARAMGLYLTALAAGGLVGRVGPALIADATNWRVGLGVLSLLPLVATLSMRASLPPEAVTGGTAVRPDRGAIRALVRNPALVGATAAGCSLFFGFVSAFSYVDYRLERPPFSLDPSLASLIFVFWVFAGIGPTAGRVAGAIGWRRVTGGGIVLSAVGLLISLAPSLPLLALGLGLFAFANFSAVTGTQLGVGAATVQDRGVASAIYYSAYYTAGALGGYVPGLAWQAWGWVGVVALAVGSLALGLAALLATAHHARDARVASAPTQTVAPTASE